MTFTPLEQKLLNDFQRDFPLSAAPFAEMAERAGASEADVLKTLTSLQARGAVSRIGGIFKPGSVGASTLVAMEVPLAMLEEVAAFISGLDTVNHNYERAHRLNLWFVVAGDTPQDVAQTLQTIEQMTNLEVLDLPMLEAFHLDLGFDLKWNGDLT